DGPYVESLQLLHNGEGYKIKRNKEHEQQFLELLESLHPNFPKQINGYYYLSFADAQKKQWFLKAYHKLLVSDIELVGMDMLNHFRFSTHRAETEMKVIREAENQVVLTVSILFGKEEVALAELQKMLWAGQRAVMLKDGSLGVLGDDWLKQYAAIIKHGKVNKKEITIARWMAITEQPAEGEEKVLGASFKENWWQRWRSWQSTPEEIFPVPVLVNASLRPYQQKGYEWMRLMEEAGAGGCLADDMGLGKTLQAICFLAAAVEKDASAKHIIICPSSLIYNWQQELEKFTPGIKNIVYHGGQRKVEQLQDPNTQVVITSYGTFRADAGNLLAIEYGTAIIDESHNIKNPSAQITRTVSTLRATVCFALSGTPVVNNTFDLYSQLNVVLPGMFGSREFFKREYADAIDRFG
ncbi:MAG: ATP-dependent helicase, partial [Sphingobacteriales bacterium]